MARFLKKKKTTIFRLSRIIQRHKQTNCGPHAFNHRPGSHTSGPGDHTSTLGDHTSTPEID